MMLQTRKTGPAAALFCMALACGIIRAQEMPSRTQAASLQAFGLISYVQPHYSTGSTTVNNTGVSLGADLDFRPLDLLEPSIELRATFAPGSDVTEKTYQFGPRLEADLGRVKPYIFLLIGTGSITFAQPIPTPFGPYTHDSSFVYSGGFGVDYMVTPRIGIRGDLMLQHWNLGGGPQASTSLPFYPHLFSFGVDYRFNFNGVRRKYH